MRRLNSGEREMLASGAGFLTRARLRVTNFNGDWIDCGALAVGSQTKRMFNTAQISDDVDRNTLSMSATVKREAGAMASLSPFRSDSVLNDAGDGTFSPLLDLHRQWAVDAVFTARGAPPTLPDDYREVKSGYIDRLDISGSQNTITLAGRGLEADLIDRRILFVDRTATPLVQITETTPKEYAGGTVGDVLQGILDDELGAGVMTLRLDPSAPSTYINPWTQTTSVGMFELMAQVAGIGTGLLRFTYDDDDVLALTLFTPPRDKTTPDWEISGTMELETLDVGIGIENIRNFPVVRFVDTSGVIQTVTSPATPASASITRYGERPIEIDLSADTKVNDEVSAQALADAVASDWELPYMEQQGTAHGLWFAELHDLVRTKANGIHYDEDQDGAIVGYTMTFANGMLANAFAFSGKVKGRYATWLTFGGGAAAAPPAAPSIVSLSATYKETVFTPVAYVDYIGVAGANTQSVLIELDTDPAFPAPFGVAAYAVVGGQFGGLESVSTADRNQIYYVRATPYSGPVVSSAVTGTAGQYVIANTIVEPKLTDTATVTWDRSTAGQYKANVAAGAVSPGGAAGGDLAGSFPNPTIASSVALTGNPTTTTQSTSDNSTKIATTAFVQAIITALKNGVSTAFDTLSEIATELGLKAPLASPALTGTPTAPTASVGTNTTQLATTAFVLANGGAPAWRYSVSSSCGNGQSKDMIECTTQRAVLHVSVTATRLAFDEAAEFVLVCEAIGGTPAWKIVRPVRHSLGNEIGLEVQVSSTTVKLRHRNEGALNHNTVVMTVTNLTDAAPTWADLSATASAALSTTALYGYERTLLTNLEQAAATSGQLMAWDDTNKKWAPTGAIASAVALPAAGVTPGTYGDSTNVGTFTVGADGRITSAVNAAISGGGGGGTPAEVLISAQSPSGTGTVNFPSISNAYRDLRIVVRGRSTASAVNVNVLARFNSDTGSNYDFNLVAASGTGAFGAPGLAVTSAQIGWIPAATAPTDVGGGCEVRIDDYRGTTFQKSGQGVSNLKQANTTGGLFAGSFSFWWRNTAAITSIDVLLSAGNYAAGSVVSLYGIL